jgi:hypothetical protein
MQVWHTDRYSKYAKYGNQRIKSGSNGGSHAEGIEGSIRTKHSALLEVMDHTRCRKVFTVQSREWSPGRLAVPWAITRKKTPAAWTSSREIAPKNLIAAHPVQGSQADEGSRGTCSPVAPCAQRYGRENQRAADMWCRDTDGENQRAADMWSRDGNWRSQLVSTIKERNSRNYVD